MSRETKAYVSAYATRDHESRLMQGEVRQYACDFNGALLGETIASATWTCDSTGLSVSGLDVEDGIATADVSAVSGGIATMTVEVTTSAGRALSQSFVVDVRSAPVASGSALSWTAP